MVAQLAPNHLTQRGIVLDDDLDRRRGGFWRT
jgi:hypothetical protein